MERKLTPLYWTLIALIAIAVIVVALRPVRTETNVLPPLDIPGPEEVAPGEGTVIATIRTGGTEIFGIQFGSVEYQLDVQFYAPPGCYETLEQGDPWPSAAPECAVDVDIAGEVSGGGFASTGDSIVSVLVDVSSDCYEATPRGSAWPLTAPACADTASG